MRRDYFKYITSLFIFGSNGIVASYILLNSYEIVFLRTLIGSLVLIAAFAITKGKCQGWKNKKHLFFMVVSGVALGTSWIFLFQAYKLIGVSMATLAYYCGPVIVMALSPFVFKEKVVPIKLFGFLSVLIGMFLVNRHSLGENGLSFGLLCGFMAAIMYAVMVIFNKKAVSITGLENSMWQLAASFITVAVYITFKQGIAVSMTRDSILPVLFLGVVNTGIGCYLYFSSIQQLPAQSVAICGYLEPISALIYATALLEEHLTSTQLVGVALILGGAAFGDCIGRQRVPMAKHSSMYI